MSSPTENEGEGGVELEVKKKKLWLFKYSNEVMFVQESNQTIKR